MRSGYAAYMTDRTFNPLRDVREVEPEAPKPESPGQKSERQFEMIRKAYPDAKMELYDYDHGAKVLIDGICYIIRETSSNLFPAIDCSDEDILRLIEAHRLTYSPLSSAPSKPSAPSPFEKALLETLGGRQLPQRTAIPHVVSEADLLRGKAMAEAWQRGLLQGSLQAPLSNYRSGSLQQAIMGGFGLLVTPYEQGEK